MNDLDRVQAAMTSFVQSGAANTEKGRQALTTLAEVFENAAVAYGTPVTASGARGDTESMISRMNRVTGRAEPSPTASRQSSSTATLLSARPSKHGPSGTPLTTPDALAAAMSETLADLASSRSHTKTLVASARWDLPSDRQLGDSDAFGNSRKMEQVCGLTAGRYDRRTGVITASGGVCLPVNVDYSVPTWATADRPLRDGLPAFQATRGGVQYVQPPDIGVSSLQAGGPTGAATATTVWTAATDADPAGATKPVWQVACGTVETEYVDAVPTRIGFGNMLSRFAPEQVAANTDVALAAAARTAELNLLTRMYASSVQVKTGQYLGALRDLLAAMDLIKSGYLYAHRIPRTAAMTAIYPEWAKDLFRSDLARELAHDNTNGRDVLAISDAQLEDWFSARGVNVIWTLDGLESGTFGTGGSAITTQNWTSWSAQVTANSGDAVTVQWPGQVDNGSFMLAGLLYVEGSFQFLDGGRLDLGVVRDSILDATNDYEMFVEPFEGIAFRGLEAVQVQSTILPTGGSAGTVAASSYHE
jgi:hypothetical protein